MGGKAAEGMEPGRCSGSSSMGAANVRLFWGMRPGKPGEGMRYRGLLVRAAPGLLLLPGLLGGSHLSCSPSRRACSRIRKPCRREEAQPSNTAERRMATSR